MATGQLNVGGALGPLLARAIVDQNGLGRRVARQPDGADRDPDPVDMLDTAPPDLTDVIDTSAREDPPWPT